MAKGFQPEEQFVEDHADRPDVHLVCYVGILGLVEALRSLIPIGTNALGSQFNFFLVLLNNLAEAEICDLNLAVVENNVLWLQVVVDDLLLLIGQVLQARQDL